jgi:uncharacterized protein YkwD
MKRIFIAILLLFAVTGCPQSNNSSGWVDWDNNSNPPITTPSEPPQANSDYSATVQTLLKLHNRERELKGRAGMVLDPYLVEYAQNYAEQMAQRDKLVHSNISVLMGKYSTAGENIAWNQRTEEEVVRDWMNSSGHRANIMNRNFTKVGFGVARAKNGSLYWCTVFGG